MHGLLIDLIDRLHEVDDSDRFDSMCIFAEGGRDAVAHSKATIHQGEEDPSFGCVLTVWQAKECVEVWSEWRGGQTPTPQDKVDAVMFYARNDAWLPVD